MSGTLVASGLSKIGRPKLAQIAVPEATSTHKPVPHHTIVEALVETLSFRHIGVVQEEFAVSLDGMKMFGVLDLETQMEGCRFSIGIRNSHDKSIRLGLTAGLRVFVCSNMAFSGDFTPATIRMKLESIRPSARVRSSYTHWADLRERPVNRTVRTLSRSVSPCGSGTAQHEKADGVRLESQLAGQRRSAVSYEEKETRGLRWST